MPVVVTATVAVSRLLRALRLALPLLDEDALVDVARTLAVECPGMRVPTPGSVDRTVLSAERRIQIRQAASATAAAELTGVTRRHARRIRNSP